MTDDTTQQPQPKESILSAKGKTSRISLEDVMPSKSPFDPKYVTAAIPVTVPQTIRLKKPVSAPTLSKPPTSNIGQGAVKSGTSIIRESPRDPNLAKRETSRVILRDVDLSAPTAEANRTTAPITGIPVSATGIPQTIRLKRSPTPTGKFKPQAAPEAPAPPVQAVGTQGKSQTSRVVLDDVLKASAASDSRTTSPVAGVPVPAPQPQTIRLKRPADTLAVETEPEEVADAGGESEKSKTAKISLPPSVVSATTPASITQRKTIKIKRAERATTPSTLVLKRSAVKAAPEPVPEEKALEEATEALEAEVAGPGWASVAIAAIALICIVGLAYLTAAQAFGPELMLPVPSFIL